MQFSIAKFAIYAAVPFGRDVRMTPAKPRWTAKWRSQRRSDLKFKMNRRNRIRIPLHTALQAEAQSIAITVSAIRKARHKNVPADFDFDSPGWYAAAEGFAVDVLMHLDGAWGEPRSSESQGLKDERNDDWFGVGAAG
ncbi:hypothetical protein [Paraburkholderia phenoliruptrix]|uniref:hypothetical protein n=1 Tax=Paraburkholderia phenoliruptrix TaxID=252970 RepID=UPI002869E4FF|nr:hypothetical protein [Paraburkholderia phenoliruptrix]WMY11054.1 hypothetical protein P3F88_30815 [Paraburkholderia phenoliruptrix]